MSTPSHHRFKITHKGQHPYNHEGSEIAYANEAFPDVASITGAIDYIAGVLYPNLRPAVANVAALPALGNALNDYRLVMDDGDGKSAGYRWAKYEDEVSPSWHKIYDIDWGLGDVLSATEAATQANYVYKWGLNDKDAAGVDIAGLYAGKRIYGGNTAGSNLTLNANSADADGVAANQTGFVQVDSQFRPAYHNSYDAGTNAVRWRTIYAETSILSGTLSLASGLITDSSGAISFGNENLTTTGFAHVADLVASGTALINADITIASGSITSASGALSFGNENLITSGTFQAGNLKFTANTLSSEDVNGNIILDPNGTGTIEALANTNITGSLTGTGDLDFVGYGEFGNIRITTNTISSQNVNGNIILNPNGGGQVQIEKDTTINATLDVTGYGEFGVMRIGTGASTNEITTTGSNRNILFRPNGTGTVVTSTTFMPETDGAGALGTAAIRFTNLFLSGSIGDGTNTMTAANLMTLRDINVGALSGMSLFYDGSKWVASIPDTEITHNTLSGLTTGDAGHTQFALLAGRAGGQSLIGGTAASENLIFESTAHATKGFVQTKDSFVPFTNASYSGSWSGTDLGGTSNYFRHIYTKGEHFGLRFENITVLPANSAQNIGRVLFDTATSTVYVDAGGSWVSFVSASAFLQGGNTFGADAFLGTNDNFDLYFERNNTALARLVTTGLQVIGDDILFNYDASLAGSDWTATIRRPSTGMTANAVHTLPDATGKITSYDSTNRNGVGLLPVGSIIPFVPGSFGDGSNGTFTNRIGAGNTIANVNLLLNQYGWYVCDGSAINIANSPIFNGAGRFLPNLTDSRFIQGSTTAGSIGGSTTNSHTHTVTSNVSVSNHADHTHSVTSNVSVSQQPAFNVPSHRHGKGNLAISSSGSHTHEYQYRPASSAGGGFGDGFLFRAIGHTAGNTQQDSTHMIASSHTHTNTDFSGLVGDTGGANGDAAFAATLASSVLLSNPAVTSAGASVTLSHSVTNNSVSSGTPTDTENRPQFLSTYYIMRVF